MFIIPNELRRLHEDGKVVFFCGAGVSVSAKLPNFKNLTEQVLNELAPDQTKAKLAWAAFKSRQYDEALGALETTEHGGFGLAVREKVKEKLSRKARGKSIAPHKSLCKLAELDKLTGKLVHTNFDTLFETALQSLSRDPKEETYKPKIEIAPLLRRPKPVGWGGLVYLHGKLGASPEERDLVLTTADFGEAYLVDGWARRFVINLFRHFHVVFVGYSVSDPIMRYLVSALAAAKAREESFRDAHVFALLDNTPDQESTDPVWNAKGIKPHLYAAHGEFWDAMSKWASDHSGGLTSKLQAIQRFGSSPPASAPDQDAQEAMTWALTDTEVAGAIAAGRADLQPSWISFLQERGMLGLRYSPDSDQALIGAYLASAWINDSQEPSWIAQRFANWIAENLAHQAISNWAIQQGCVLHHHLRYAVERALGAPEGKPIGEVVYIPEGFRKFWSWLSDANYAHDLSAYRHSKNYPPGLGFTSLGNTSRALIDSLKPIPVFKEPYPQFGDEPEPTFEKVRDVCRPELKLVGIFDRRDLDKLREHQDWNDLLANLADDITTQLMQALRILDELELVSKQRDYTHVALPSVDYHLQNQYAKTWTILIELARESFCALADRNLKGAERLAKRWQSLPYPIFKRLCLHAATVSPNVANQEFALEALLHGDPLALWNVDTQRETLRYLREQGATLTGSALSTLADAILRGPNAADGREPEQRNWHSIRLRLWKLQTSGAELPRTAKERLHQIDEKMPWHSTDDFSEEFPVYVSAGWSGDLIGRQNVRFQAMSDTDFIAWLNSKQDDVLPGENGWEDFCRDHPVQALSLLKAASAQELWPEDQWRYLFWALQETHETEATTALLDVLDKMPDETLQKIGLETARWLEKQRQHLDTESWLSAWDRVWQTNVGGDGEREGPPTLDLTLNEAGGVLGSAMLDQLGAQIPSVNADEKPGIPGNLAVYFHPDYSPGSMIRAAGVA